MNDVYKPVAMTADGRWYYQGQSSDYFVYYDTDCDGAGSFPLRWIIDNHEPLVIKNRFRKTANSGYADVLVNLKVGDHVCERGAGYARESATPPSARARAPRALMVDGGGARSHR